MSSVFHPRLVSCFRGRSRLLTTLIPCGLIVMALASCGRIGPTSEQAQVTQAFESWKSALIDHKADKSMAYIPRHVDDYLAQLNSPATVPAPPSNTVQSLSPGVDHLLRTALQKKVPADLRAKLTLSALLQRITEKNLFNPRDIRQIALGRVTITDPTHATAEVYYQNTLTALRLPFIKEGDAWKIDVMALLPYAELLMHVDRAIKGETEAQQVDQLVSKLPSL